MTRERIGLLVGLIVVATLGIAVLQQERALVRARAEQAALLSQQHGSSGPVQQTLPVGPVSEGVQSQPSELEGLRQETQELQQKISEFTSQAQSFARASAQVSAQTVSTEVKSPPLATFRTAEARDAGQETPAALIQTFLWAIPRGDSNRLAQLLTAEPSTSPDALQELLAELSKSGFGDDGPQEVRILKEAPAENGDRWITTQEIRKDGSEQNPERVRFRLTDTGWRVLVGTNGEPVVDREP